MIKKRDKVVLIMRGPLFLCERAAVLLCILKPSFVIGRFLRLKIKDKRKTTPTSPLRAGGGNDASSLIIAV